MAHSPEAFFLEQPGGHRFCLHYPVSHGLLRGLCVYLHPWAEEMNKSRRMAALGARALADAGYAVLQIDLLGCGDSSGDFEAANWSRWIQDVHLACQWLRARYPASAGQAQAPLCLWGLRAGCLLGAAAAAQLQLDCHFLFWQPTLSGQQVLNPFLRLAWAEQLHNTQAATDLAGIRQRLAQGTSVEIAGYTLSAALAEGLARAQLHATPQANAACVAWLELSTTHKSEQSVAARASVTAWRRQGYAVEVQLLQGPAFWQSSEIETAPALINASLAALEHMTTAVPATAQVTAGVQAA